MCLFNHVLITPHLFAASPPVIQELSSHANPSFACCAAAQVCDGKCCGTGMVCGNDGKTCVMACEPSAADAVPVMLSPRCLSARPQPSIVPT